MDNPFNKYTILQLSDEINSTATGYKFILAPNDSLIHDTRGLHNFKTTTLGGHKRQDVISGLEKAITQGQIELACYWSIQMLCSGYAYQLWDKLLLYAVKNINIASPALPMWISSKARIWVQMTQDKKEFTKAGILHMRNLQQFRNIIAEVVVALCQSRKRKLDSGGVRVTDQDFIVSTFQSKCVATSTNYLAGLVGPNDTQEVVIAANEFYHHLLHKDISHTLYWLQWILQWEKQNIRRYKSFQVQSRQIEGIADIHQRDIIWLIWSIFHNVRQRMLDATKQQNPAMSDQATKIELQLNALWDMYIQGWKPGSKTRKLPILIWCIEYLVYPLDWSINAIHNLPIYVKAIASINKMYTKLANTQCISLSPTKTNIINPMTTAIQNNYITLDSPINFNNASPQQSLIDAVPSPPLQINTQLRPSPSISTKPKPRKLGAINRELTNDERSRLGWMSIGLQ